jgi:hypothetical protein
MLKKLFLVLMFLLFTISLTFAQEIDDEILKLQELQGQEIPGIAGRLFGNERINLYVDLNDGTRETITILTKKKIFISLEKGELENPTLIVYTTEQTLRELQNSENILQTFETYLKNGDISYQALGIGKKIKFGFLKILGKVFGLV